MTKPIVRNSFLHFEDEPCPRKRLTRSSSCPPVIACREEDGEGSVSACSETTRGSSSGGVFDTVPDIHPYATTVMVRNIPTRFTSVSFLRVLDDTGFAGTYSFFYLPMDFRTGKNMGYCFINFLTPPLAALFANIFHGTRLGVTSSHKVVQVSTSRRQGLVENVALFRGSDLLSSLSLPLFKPFVLFNGGLHPLCEYLFELIIAGHF